MSERRRFVLVHPQARQRAQDAVRMAPDGWEVIVQPPRRNLSQNAALHAKLGEIAESRQWAGKSWDIETWKRLMVGAWSRARGESIVMLPALDGAGVDIVFRRTSQMTQAECSELLEFVTAWEAQTQ